MEGTSSPLHLIEMEMPDETNWPWGGESITISSSSEGDKIIGRISSIGYSTSDANTVLALSIIQSEECKSGDDVIVEVGTSKYQGKIYKSR